MTDVTPNPRARVERLLTRARAAHEMVTRIEEDLRGSEEGKHFAHNAQVDLSGLCLRLEELSRG